MNKILVVILVLAVLGAAAWFYAPEREQVAVFHVVTAKTSTATDQIHLSGSFSLQNPELIRTGVNGRLEWLVEDNAWVEAGEPLYILNDQEALEDLSSKRETLVDAEQDLRIALLKKEQTRAEEQRKVEAAQRKAQQADIRHRILVGEPKGGDHLITLEKELSPKLLAIDDLEIKAQNADDTYRSLEDAFYAALDTWQNAKDEVLRIQSEIDGARMNVRAGESIDADDETKTKAAEAAKLIPELEKKLSETQGQVPTLAKAREDARDAMEKGLPKRKQAQQTLLQAEAAILDKLIEVEIEKKRLNITTLNIDRDIAAVELASAEARLEDGKLAFADGALSQDELNTLSDRFADAEHRIAVLDQRMAIAKRPPSREELAESELAVASADRDALRAEEAMIEALDREQRKIEVLQKQIIYHRHNVDQILEKFPTAMEATITYLQQERLTLEEGDTERRAEIDKQINDLQAKLDAAAETPPNVGQAAVSGVVQIIRRWGRHPYSAGDSVSADQVLIKLFPPGNLELEAKVNEVEVNKLQPGQAIIAQVPALDGLKLTGQVARISGIGEDIFQGYDTIGGITMFPVQITVNDPPKTLRPGMSALISVSLAEESEALTIPLQAAREKDGDFIVNVGTSPENIQQRRVTGRVIGVDTLRVDDGIRAGEQLLVFSERGSP